MASVTDGTGEAFDVISCALIIIDRPVNSSSRISKIQPHLAGHLNQKKSNLP